LIINIKEKKILKFLENKKNELHKQSLLQKREDLEFDCLFFEKRKVSITNEHA